MPNNSKATRRTSMRWALTAAIAGPVIGLLASPVSAQYRINQDGAARDANNRVGSNGRNDSAPRYGTGVTPDMIIYGNVTNNKYFRGPIAAPDARAFRGQTVDVSDRFIRDSTGGYDRTTVAQQFTANPYYGTARGVEAPAGYVPTKTTTAYSPNLINNQFSTAATLGSLSTGEGLVPRLGSTITALPTPTSAQQPNSALVMSPLGGIRQLGFGDEGATNDLYTIRNGMLVPSGSATDRFRTDGQMIDKIRGELMDPATEGEEKPKTGLEGSQPLGQPLEGPASSQLKPQSVGGTNLGGQPIQGSLETGQGTNRRLATAAQQSEQMSELERRLQDRQGGRPLSGQEIQRDLNAAAKKVANPAGANTPGNAAPGGAQPGAAQPGAVTPRPVPGAAPADPLMIKSLATGVKAKSLADVLTRAEGLMKEGKFAEALDQYDLAERAAPNNSLITLGRANAELGASSYRSAYTHIRQAVSTEPALLLGRYDLAGMMGGERLQILTKDLRDLAANEPLDPMPSFLLAYIQYNAGQGAEAAGHLNEVEKRAGAEDPVVAKMRELWSLPGGNLNK